MVTLGGSDAYTAGQFFQGLTADAWQGPLALPAGRKLTTVVPGQAEGPIVGGNLTVLTSLVGTPYALDGMGCILVLEDTGEDAYRIDRMLNQLWQSGLLSRVAAIAYGDFTDCPNDPGDFTTDQVLDYYAHLAGKPAIKGLPVGHTKDKAFVPYGVKVRSMPIGRAHRLPLLMFAVYGRCNICMSNINHRLSAICRGTTRGARF